jgi:hypothetical protein
MRSRQARPTALFLRFGVMFFADPVTAFREPAERRFGRAAGWASPCWQPVTENPWMLVPLMAAVGIVPFAIRRRHPTRRARSHSATADRVRHILGDAGFRDVALESFAPRRADRWRHRSRRRRPVRAPARPDRRRAARGRSRPSCRAWTEAVSGSPSSVRYAARRRDGVESVDRDGVDVTGSGAGSVLCRGHVVRRLDMHEVSHMTELVGPMA